MRILYIAIKVAIIGEIHLFTQYTSFLRRLEITVNALLEVYAENVGLEECTEDLIGAGSIWS